MGMHTLEPGTLKRRIGIGAFEIAVRCACKHYRTERETGCKLQPWAAGGVADYMRAFRYDPFTQTYRREPDPVFNALVA